MIFVINFLYYEQIWIVSILLVGRRYSSGVSRQFSGWIMIPMRLIPSICWLLLSICTSVFRGLFLSSGLLVLIFLVFCILQPCHVLFPYRPFSALFDRGIFSDNFCTWSHTRFAWSNFRFDKNDNQKWGWGWIRGDVRSPKQWFLKSG